MLPEFCDGIPRRDFLRIGSLAGLSLAEILRLQSVCALDARAKPASGAGKSPAKKDINVIFLFLVGGIPQQDMFDLKPAAPAEIRGDFKPIATKTPGLQFAA